MINFLMVKVDQEGQAHSNRIRILLEKVDPKYLMIKRFKW